MWFESPRVERITSETMDKDCVRMYLAATVRYGNELRQALLPTEAYPKS